MTTESIKRYKSILAELLAENEAEQEEEYDPELGAVLFAILFNSHGYNQGNKFSKWTAARRPYLRVC